MKTTLRFLFLFISVSLSAQNWVDLNFPTSINASDAAITVHPTTGETYIAYANANDGNKTYVVKYDGTTWIDVVGPINPDNSSLQSIAIHPTTNNLWVSFVKTSEKRVRIYEQVNGVMTRRSVGAIYELTLLSERPRLTFNSNGIALLSTTGVSGTGNSRAYFKKILYYDASQNGFVNRTVTTNDNIAVMNRLGEYSYNLSKTSTPSSNIIIRDGRTSNIQHQFNIAQINISRMIEINDFWVGYKFAGELQFGKLSDISLEQPNDLSNGQTDFLYIDQYSSTDDLYLMYSDVNKNLRFEVYNVFTNSWDTNIMPTLNANTSSSDFFVNATMTAYNKFYNIVYKNDAGNVSVKQYQPAPALSRYYVDANATGNGSGDSWTNAFTDLTQALGALEEGVTNEIWVAQGTYRSQLGQISGFEITKNNFTIYGGFNGTETSLSERDVRANETIFSGDANANDTGVSYTNSTRADNAWHVFDIQSNGVTLDGLTISDGHADNSGNAEDGRNGGAVFVGDGVSSFTLKNCTLKNNVAYSGAGAVRAWAHVDLSITIENCIFENNLARWAASVYLLNDPNANIDATISNNLFANNTTSNRGSNGGSSGDLWIRGYSTGTVNATISQCTFANFSSLGTNSNIIERSAIGLSKTNGTTNINVYNTVTYNHNTTAGHQVIGVGKIRTQSSYPNSVVIANSIGQNGFNNATQTTNTTSADPLFVDATNNDFTLAANSPAIDSGDNSFIPTGITNDLLFNERMHNTTVDMGAFEFGASSTLSTDSFFSSINPFSIYPNPFSRELNIKSEEKVSLIRIINNLGQLVYQTKNKTLNVIKLKAGLYFIEIVTDNGKTFRKKIVKR